MIQLHVEDPNETVMLLGISDQNMKLIEEQLTVSVLTRGDTISISGDEDNRNSAKALLEQLLKVIRKGININQRDVSTALEMVKSGTIEYFAELYDEEISRNMKGKAIRAKTIGQREYVSAIRSQGSCILYWASRNRENVLSCRTSRFSDEDGFCEANYTNTSRSRSGRELGFLPGDLKEKVDPYFRPLYDALHDVLGAEQTDRLMERGVIEIAPLAYMRGRTLDDAFIILDEAQNTTKAQMKMFLTRLGFGSKMVINGDKTQIDLPRDTESGLIVAESILKQVGDIHFQYLEQGDVVRHPIVAKIIEAYEQEQS